MENTDALTPTSYPARRKELADMADITEAVDAQLDKLLLDFTASVNVGTDDEGLELFLLAVQARALRTIVAQTVAGKVEGRRICDELVFSPTRLGPIGHPSLDGKCGLVFPHFDEEHKVGWKVTP